MHRRGAIKQFVQFALIDMLSLMSLLLFGKLNILPRASAIKPSTTFTSSVAAFAVSSRLRTRPRRHHRNHSDYSIQNRLFSSPTTPNANAELVTPNTTTEDANPDDVSSSDSSTVDAPKRHTVTWQTQKGGGTDGTTDHTDNNISFHVYEGETLRTAALRRNVVSPHNGRANLINCRGLGTCGTCAVEIISQGSSDDDDGVANGGSGGSGDVAAVDPPERNTVEKLRLNFPPHNFHDNAEKLRLACQIQVRGDITVVKHTGFWGQKEEVEGSPSVPTRPFGELEYLLDGKSPPEKYRTNKKKPE
mmetsp:Transcript_22582/g.40724  ORF Transcript_22582/g.40724 Transcript_22582/m.40724 type:complete len:304 (+) Transcript_22582:2-913(+)